MWHSMQETCSDSSHATGYTRTWHALSNYCTKGHFTRTCARISTPTHRHKRTGTRIHHTARVRTHTDTHTDTQKQTLGDHRRADCGVSDWSVRISPVVCAERFGADCNDVRVPCGRRARHCALRGKQRTAMTTPFALTAACQASCSTVCNVRHASCRQCTECNRLDNMLSVARCLVRAIKSACR